MPPRAKNFKAGSIIYFTGDKAEHIFLLKEGKVNLIYDDVTTGEELIDALLPGEFFGVKSGILHFPREETAKVIQNSIIFEFTANDFEALIIKNTGIILKMLKAFSNQLRKVGRQIQALVGKTVSTDPSDDFFDIGDFYLKNKKYKQATTVYQRYLNYYPNGNYSALAKKRLQVSQESFKNYGDGGGPTPVIDKPAAMKSSKSSGEEEEHAESDIKDAFATDVFEEKASRESKNYYKGLSFISQGKYLDAFNIFKKIIESGNEEEKKLASSEIGKCFFYLKKYNECIKHLTAFLGRNSGYNEKDELLYFVASSYQNIGESEKAKKIFVNITSSNDESNSTFRKAKKALKELA